MACTPLETTVVSPTRGLTLFRAGAYRYKPLRGRKFGHAKLDGDHLQKPVHDSADYIRYAIEDAGANFGEPFDVIF